MKTHPTVRAFWAAVLFCSIFISPRALGETVEVSNDINANIIWRETNTYHITDNISVQSLLVIEPGTVITFASDCGLFVNNGGTIIANGTPSKLITFTSDSASPIPGIYDFAIYIEETASPSSQVNFCLVKFAGAGIYTDNIRLEEPIANNFVRYCSFGIFEWGTSLTDIINNQIYYCP